MYKRADEFNCETCNQKYCTASPDPRWPQSIGRAPIPIWTHDDYGELYTCIKPLVTPFSYELMNLFMHYKNSVFPLAGGLYDQPAKYRQAMDYLSAARG